MNKMILEAIDRDLEDCLYKWLIEYSQMYGEDWGEHIEEIKNHIINLLNKYSIEIKKDIEK